jgi:hypothetical protein
MATPSGVTRGESVWARMDGFIILRHPDWRTANGLADIAANEITMYAE